jgi:hypothetical protein
MAKKTKQIQDIQKIRTIMEKTTPFLSLSGLSGIAAGLTGCLAGTIMMLKIQSVWISRDLLKDVLADYQLRIFFTILLLSALFLATLISFVITALNTIKKNQPLWVISSFRFAENLFIPLLTGGVLLTAFYFHKNFEYFIPGMLIFFGLALYCASQFSKDEIKVLGILEICLGLLSLYFIPAGLILWTAGFGLLNIGYGIYMYVKYER